MGKKFTQAKPNPVGRPTECTPELINKICECLLSGNYLDIAARRCGVSNTTLYNWLKRAHDEPGSVFEEFLRRVDQAEAEAEARAISQMEELAASNWQALAWRMERKWAKRWGKKNGEEGEEKEQKPIIQIYIPGNNREVAPIVEQVAAVEVIPAITSGEEWEKHEAEKAVEAIIVPSDKPSEE